MEAAKVLKVLLVLRHTFKGGQGEDGQELSGELIGPVGREAIKKTLLLPVIDDSPVDLFHTGLIRTTQCLLTFAVSYGFTGHLHDPLLNLGNQGLFDSWMKQGLKENMKKQPTTVKALIQTLGEDGWKEVCANCGADIKTAFDRMQERFGLVNCHTPTAEAAASYYGFDCRDVQLKENEGLFFAQDIDGQITCLGLWKSGEVLNLE